MPGKQGLQSKALKANTQPSWAISKEPRFHLMAARELFLGAGPQLRLSLLQVVTDGQGLCLSQEEFSSRVNFLYSQLSGRFELLGI